MNLIRLQFLESSFSSFQAQTPAPSVTVLHQPAPYLL
uniref:Uncharacterized protein n=1 Tax=Arundo donax TaxID=35708 RepID=A0A0A9I8S6_ARUDO